METPELVFTEYEVDVIASQTDRPYHQTYMGRLVSENGKIKLIGEAIDKIPVARSLFRTDCLTFMTTGNKPGCYQTFCGSMKREAISSGTGNDLYTYFGHAGI